jgi:hypothetical protein
MLGNPKLPEQASGHHNALADAQWNRVAHEFLGTLADANSNSSPSLHRRQDYEG